MRRALQLLRAPAVACCLAAVSAGAAAGTLAAAAEASGGQPTGAVAPAPSSTGTTTSGTQTTTPSSSPRRRSPPSPAQALRLVLTRSMRLAGAHSGALVVDLTTGRTLLSVRAGVPRIPASVEKLYTTATVLARFGATATLTTQLLGVGAVDSTGAWNGTLYLRGAGDPTFGDAKFDTSTYGTGATLETLVSKLDAATGLDAVDGRVVGDESLFDSLRGTPPYGYAFNSDVEGSLSALAFDRGVSADWSTPTPQPPLTAAKRLLAALGRTGVDVSAATPAAGSTPAGARLLAQVSSPPMATLVALTNAPSDNFFAEMLLKDLGAAFGGGGSTAAGAAVVRAQLRAWSLHPRLEDGSGLSRWDATSPVQVVALLRRLANLAPFTASLAVVGRTGTLYDRMRHTRAQGRCLGKTGTLHDVSSLVGYCLAADGHHLAYALLMNSVDPYAMHPVQDRMVEAIAAYRG